MFRSLAPWVCSLTKNQSRREATCTRARNQLDNRRGFRRLIALQAAILHSWKHAPSPSGPVEGERPLDEHQSTRWSESAANVDPRVVRSALARSPLRVVDAVDLPRLGRVRERRQRHVHITTGLAQNIQLVVHAAPPAVGPGVVERPVSVDERVPNLARLRIARRSPWRSDKMSRNSVSVRRRFSAVSLS